jgi:hypothetical protein
LLFVALAGCGGGGDGAAPDGASLSPSDAQAVCADACAHLVSCGSTSDMAACQTDCVTQSNLFRGDGYRGWIECITAADCADTNAGEACYVETVAKLPARDVHDQYVERCSVAETQCGGLTAGACDLDQVIMFSDDYMGGQVLPCFDLACDALVACLETNVLDAF